MATNLELFADEVFSTIKAVGDRLLARIVVLEQRQPVNGKDGAKGDKGDPGESIDPLFVQRLMDRLETLEAKLEAKQLVHGKDGVDGKDGAPGKDADPEAIKALGDRVAALDLKFAGFYDLEPGTDGKDGAPGRDGASVTVDDVRPVIEEAVQKTLAAWPAPKDGQDGAPGAIGPQGERGPQGEPGRDGRDGMQGLSGLQGEKGERGIDGINGKDGADGLHGKDGRDAVMGTCKIVTLEDGTKTWAWSDGTPVEGGRIRELVYLGVWKSGQAYETGESVTHAGSLWTCLQPTTEKPGDAQGGKFWQLAVKRGMDGREGKQGPQGPSGPKGDKGDPGMVYR